MKFILCNNVQLQLTIIIIHKLLKMYKYLESFNQFDAYLSLTKKTLNIYTLVPDTLGWTRYLLLISLLSENLEF